MAVVSTLFAMFASGMAITSIILTCTVLFSDRCHCIKVTAQFSCLGYDESSVFCFQGAKYVEDPTVTFSAEAAVADNPATSEVTVDGSISAVTNAGYDQADLDVMNGHI